MHRDGSIQLVTLCEAVAAARERLRLGLADGNARLLHTIALAISELMPIYTRDSGQSSPRPLTEAEILAGRFTLGATRLEFLDGRPSLADLAVPSSDLDRALSMLRPDWLERPRALLTLRQSAKAPSGDDAR